MAAIRIVLDIDSAVPEMPQRIDPHLVAEALSGEEVGEEFPMLIDGEIATGQILSAEWG